MSSGRSLARTWGRGLVVLLVCAVAAALLWLMLRRQAPRGELQREQPAPVPAAVAVRPAAEAPAPVAPRPHAHVSTAVPADPFDPIYAGPGPDDPAGPGMLPHPITPEHLRIYRDVELLDGAWQALKRKDFALARVLLRQHAGEYGSDRPHDDIHQGLTLLADCMERPSAETRERAQRFYDQYTASTARRRIRTHCLQAL